MRLRGAIRLSRSASQALRDLPLLGLKVVAYAAKYVLTSRADQALAHFASALSTATMASVSTRGAAAGVASGLASGAAAVGFAGAGVGASRPARLRVFVKQSKARQPDRQMLCRSRCYPKASP